MINGVEWLEHRGSVGRALPRTEIRRRRRQPAARRTRSARSSSVPPRASPIGHADVAADLRRHGLARLRRLPLPFRPSDRHDPDRRRRTSIRPRSRPRSNRRPASCPSAVVGPARSRPGRQGPRHRRVANPAVPHPNRRSSPRSWRPSCRGTRSRTPASSSPRHCVTKPARSGASDYARSEPRPRATSTCRCAEPGEATEHERPCRYPLRVRLTAVVWHTCVTNSSSRSQSRVQVVAKLCLCAIRGTTNTEMSVAALNAAASSLAGGRRPARRRPPRRAASTRRRNPGR